MNKEEFIKNLRENLSTDFKQMLLKKGISEKSYGAVEDIIIDSATHGYDAGFEAARVSYATKVITTLAEIFKK